MFGVMKTLKFCHPNVKFTCAAKIFKHNYVNNGTISLQKIFFPIPNEDVNFQQAIWSLVVYSVKNCNFTWNPKGVYSVFTISMYTYFLNCLCWMNRKRKRKYGNISCSSYWPFPITCLYACANRFYSPQNSKKFSKFGGNCVGTNPMTFKQEIWRF